MSGRKTMRYLFGMILSFAIFALIGMLLRRRQQTPMVYDEMQNAVRGTAYRYAMITGVISGIISAFLVSADLLPVDGGFAMMTTSFLMVTVYVVYMVTKGVYFGVSGKWKSWTALIFIIGLANLISGIGNIIQNGLHGGRLTINNIDIMMGTMFLIIVAAVMVKRTAKSQEED